jgi:hypothetical protein
MVKKANKSDILLAAEIIASAIRSEKQLNNLEKQLK